jgi:calcineurin-like phosphoesterase family protein
MQNNVIYNFPGAEQENRVFFTSDSHYFHRNIMKYCNRPFETVEEMNETLIANWNNKVGKDDCVFHLGDFCFGGPERWKKIRERLNGNIVLIIGNHDMSSVRPNTLVSMAGDIFYDVVMETSVRVNGQLMVLNHYPLLSYSGMYENRCWNLFGHVHLRPGYTLDYESQLAHLRPCQYDVGVDMNGFAPVSFAEVKTKINEQIKENKNCLMWI